MEFRRGDGAAPTPGRAFSHPAGSPLGTSQLYAALHEVLTFQVKQTRPSDLYAPCGVFKGVVTGSLTIWLGLCLTPFVWPSGGARPAQVYGFTLLQHKCQYFNLTFTINSIL